MAKLNIPVSVLQSDVSGRVPLPDQLKVRQLWINTADGLLGTKTEANQVVTFAQLTQEQKQKATASVQYDGIATDGGSNVTRFAICETVAESVTKTITVENYNQVVGATVIVKFVKGSKVNNPVLSVSGNPALPIISSGKPLNTLPAESVIWLVCTGTKFETIGAATASIDYSAYYTREEAIAKFASIKAPTIAGELAIVSASDSAGKAITARYYEAQESSETSIIDAYTKEEMDAMFAPITNPVVINAPMDAYSTSAETGRQLQVAYEQALSSGSTILTKDECKALFIDILTPKTVGEISISSYQVAKLTAKLLSKR